MKNTGVHNAQTATHLACRLLEGNLVTLPYDERRYLAIQLCALALTLPDTNKRCWNQSHARALLRQHIVTAMHGAWSVITHQNGQVVLQECRAESPEEYTAIPTIDEADQNTFYPRILIAPIAPKTPLPLFMRIKELTKSGEAALTSRLQGLHLI